RFGAEIVEQAAVADVLVGRPAGDTVRHRAYDRRKRGRRDDTEGQPKLAMVGLDVLERQGKKLLLCRLEVLANDHGPWIIGSQREVLEQKLDEFVVEVRSGKRREGKPPSRVVRGPVEDDARDISSLLTHMEVSEGHSVKEPGVPHIRERVSELRGIEGA